MAAMKDNLIEAARLLDMDPDDLLARLALPRVTPHSLEDAPELMEVAQQLDDVIARTADTRNDLVLSAFFALDVDPIVQTAIDDAGRQVNLMSAARRILTLSERGVVDLRSRDDASLLWLVERTARELLS